MSTGLVTQRLTDTEITFLVERYEREIARYEDVALRVAQRLRQALRTHAVRVLLSPRAKHPDDLQKKLEDRAQRNDPRYTFANLSITFHRVVTDLAGCRILVYRPMDIAHVERVVLDTFPNRPDLDGAFEQHDKPSGYRATHMLVELGADEERPSLRGSICELQLASLGAHLYNEIEHDIAYKERDFPPTEDERRALDELLLAARVADAMAERIAEARAAALTSEQRGATLRNAHDLRLVLEAGVGRRVDGELETLFLLLKRVVKPLRASFFGAAEARRMIDAGAARAKALGLSRVDDGACIALALSSELGAAFAEAVRTHERENAPTPLTTTILEALERGA